MGAPGTLTLVTAPTVEPLGLTETKLFCRIDIADDDVLVSDLIAAARLHFDGPTSWFGRALMTQTWELRLDRFPSGGAAIDVPLPPLQAVGSITYVDADGVTQTLDPLRYVVDPRGGLDLGRITLAPGASWPATRATVNAVTVRFTAGYGSSPAAVPYDVRVWLRQVVAHLYRQRETPTVPEDFYWSLVRYRVAWSF